MPFTDLCGHVTDLCFEVLKLYNVLMLDWNIRGMEYSGVLIAGSCLQAEPSPHNFSLDNLLLHILPQQYVINFSFYREIKCILRNALNLAIKNPMYFKNEFYSTIKNCNFTVACGLYITLV